MPSDSNISKKFSLNYEGDLSPHSFNVVDFNDGLVSSHEELTSADDDVVIVGGGYGVTAVRAAQIAGEAGQIVIYEGGEEQAEAVRKTTNINNVSSRCEIQHAIIGQEEKLYGEAGGAKRLSPTEIPDCDVLEMDCEGSELQILKNMEIRPESLIIELHPNYYPDNVYGPIETIQEMGYELTHLAGQDGIEVTKSGLDELLEKSRDMIGTHSPDRTGDKYLESGARWPVVVGASLNRN